MTITVNGEVHDTLADVCQRFHLARKTVLAYIDNGTFTEPPRHLQGATQQVRYFPESWYAINEPVLVRLRGQGRKSEEPDDAKDESDPPSQNPEE